MGWPAVAARYLELYGWRQSRAAMPHGGRLQSGVSGHVVEVPCQFAIGPPNGPATVGEPDRD